MGGACVETELKHIDPSVFFGGDVASPDTLGRFYADVQMYANSGVDPRATLAPGITAQIAGAANSFLGRNVQRFQSDEYDRFMPSCRARPMSNGTTRSRLRSTNCLLAATRSSR